MNNKPHAGKGNQNAKGHGRTLKYGEKTAMASKRLPLSRVKEAQSWLDNFAESLLKK